RRGLQHAFFLVSDSSSAQGRMIHRLMEEVPNDLADHLPYCLSVVTGSPFQCGKLRGEQQQFHLHDLVFFVKSAATGPTSPDELLQPFPTTLRCLHCCLPPFSWHPLTDETIRHRLISPCLVDRVKALGRLPAGPLPFLRSSKQRGAPFPRGR